MDPARVTNARATQAYIVAAFLGAVGAALFVSLLDTLRVSTLTEGFSGIANSPWALSALADYIVGACFAALYVYLRDGSSVFCLSNKLFAVVFPFVGNFALLWYVAFLIFRARDVTLGLLPYTTEGSSGPLNMRSEGSAKQSKVIGSVFFGLLLGFAAVCFWASKLESLREGYVILRTVKWAGFLFIDNLTGLLFTVMFVIVREGELNCITTLWIISFTLFGNAPTCLYVIHMAQLALTRDVPFSMVLLSRKKQLSVHSALVDDIDQVV